MDAENGGHLLKRQEPGNSRRDRLRTSRHDKPPAGERTGPAVARREVGFLEGMPRPVRTTPSTPYSVVLLPRSRPCRRWEPGCASYPMTERSAVEVFVVVLIIVGEVLALVGDVLDAFP